MLLLVLPLVGGVPAVTAADTATTTASTTDAGAGTQLGQAPAVWPHSARDGSTTYVAVEDRAAGGVTVHRLPKDATAPDRSHTLGAREGAFDGGRDAIDIAAADGNVYVAWMQFGEPAPVYGSVDLFISVSRDSGVTFDSPRRLSTPDGASAWGPRLAADGNAAVVAWAEGKKLRVAATTDAGASFNDRDVADLADSHAYDIAMAGASVYVAYRASDHLELRRSTDGGQSFSLRWIGSKNGLPGPPVVAATSIGVYVLWGRSTAKGDGTYTGEVTVTASLDGGGSFGDYELAKCGPAGYIACNSYDAAVHGDRVFFAANEGHVGEARVVTSWTQADAQPGRPTVIGTAYDMINVDVAVDAVGMYVAWSASSASNRPWRLTVSSRLHLRKTFDTTGVTGDGDSHDVGAVLAAWDGSYGLGWMRVTSQTAPKPLHPSIRFLRGSVADGDVQVISAEAVQAPYDVKRLIAGKPTVARVKVRSGLPTAMLAELSLTYRKPGTAGTTVTTQVLLRQGPNTFFLPDNVPFKPGEGELEVSAKFDPNNRIVETDEGNNTSKSPTYRVKQTRAFRMLVVPLKSPNEAGPTCAEVQTVARGAKEFVSAAFPLDPTKVTVDDNCATPVETLQPGPWEKDFGLGMDVLAPLDKLNASGGYDEVIGVVRPGWIKDNWIEPALGVAHVGSNRRAVVVDAKASGGSVAGHEILHQMGWVGIDADKHDKDHVHHLVETLAEGYWVDRRQEMARIDLMYFEASATPAASDDRWISPPTWDFLVDRFATNPVDPPLIYLDGSIAQDGTVTTGTWFETDGFLDSVLGAEGDLGVRYRGADGTLLGQTAIDTTNTICVDGVDSVCSMGPESSFTARVPDVAGTASLELVRDGAVIYSRTRSATRPTVAVTSPAAGDVLAAGADVEIKWNAADADGDALSSAVSLSTDGGTTWRPLAAEVSGGSLTVRAVHEFTGPDVRVRLSVSDGWNTTHAMSGSFAVQEGVRNGDLVFTKAQTFERGDIWRTDVDGVDRQLTSNADRPSGFAAAYPDWSPDGARIAFNTTDGGGADVILDMDRFGGDRRQLAISADEDLRCVDWSPDGERLLTLRSQADSRWSIVAYDVATGVAEVITTGVDFSCPRWSPDGARVVFTALDRLGTSQVYVADVATGAQTPLTTGDAHGQGHHFTPAFSPDGSSVAYLAYGPGDMWGYKVWVINADGSNPRVLGPPNPSGCSCGIDADVGATVNWTPDGAAIVFTFPTLTSGDAIYDVWTIPSSGGTATRVTSNTDWTVRWTHGDYQPLRSSDDGAETPPAPVLADAGGPYEAVEGSPVALDASASKVGSGSPSYAWDLDGDGEYDDASEAKPAVTFPGSGEVRVAVRVADASGASSTASAVVHVANAAPVFDDVTAVADGVLVSVTGVVTDGGSDDTVEVTVEWADGTTTNVPLVHTSDGATFYAGHSYADGDAGRPVRVTADDGDGGSAAKTVTPVVAPANTPPTIGDLSAETPAGVPVPLTFAAADADGDALRLRLASAPAHGGVVGVDEPIVPGTGGQLWYVPDGEFSGIETFTVVADDGEAVSAPATVTVRVIGKNAPPSCAELRATPNELWSTTWQLVPVAISGATDADGDALTVSVTTVTQDEPVGTVPDASRTSASETVQLRAKRDGEGDGRVYRVTVEVVDGKGGVCTGTVVVIVPHDQYGKTAIDSGGVFDSFKATTRG